MTRAQQLAGTLTEIFAGDPWYSTSLEATLAGILPVLAAKRPIAAAHSIWEIAEHITAWNEVCLRRLAGETVGEPPVNFAGPAAVSPAEWRQVQARVEASCRRVIAKAAQMTDAELAAIVPGKEYRADFLIEGIGQHWVYHSGQIAMLRRA